ncbi:hypothetical protein [Phenylobacterium sp.]|uniref:hypothetical protein n=1 Tax=Phenylobacterium sp. TaxID=1871053 RepID=UPI002F408D3F
MFYAVTRLKAGPGMQTVQKMSLPTLTAMVVGSMVGAGIFSLPRTFGNATGPVGGRNNAAGAPAAALWLSNIVIQLFLIIESLASNPVLPGGEVSERGRRPLLRG